ncbi:hypothetical protein QV65_13175 [Rhodococcus erythropolis]|nr:hypothetical protein QV65_13175 [Rhodococcus erythropolis]
MSQQLSTLKYVRCSIGLKMHQLPIQQPQLESANLYRYQLSKQRGNDMSKCIGVLGRLFGHKFGRQCNCDACSHCGRCGIKRG